LGRTRGGLTTKIHAAVNEAGQPLRVIITPGNVHDTKQAINLLSPIICPDIYILGDRGYVSFSLLQYIAMQMAVAVIPPKSNTKEPWDYDKERYKNRNKVEKFFNSLKQYRRIATRYDKRLRYYLAFVHLAAALILIPKWPPISSVAS
jgi:transposase